MTYETVTQFSKMLGNLSAILGKASAYADQKKFDVSVLLNARLAPDQFPFIRQVQITCDTAKAYVAKLTGKEAPKHEDTEQSFAELKARIAKTLQFVDGFKPAQLEGSDEREVTIRQRGQDVRMTGLDYLLAVAQPNFYFHVATAYNILRHNGVEIGKRDFLG